MTTVYCADNSCKHNEDGICGRDFIGLKWCSVMTAYDGRQEYLRCNEYEESRRSKEIAEFMRNKGFDFGTGVKEHG